MLPIPSSYFGGNITLSGRQFQTVYSHWSPWYKPKQTQKLSEERNNHRGVIVLLCFAVIFRFFILILHYTITLINEAQRGGLIGIVLALQTLAPWREIFHSA